MLLIYIYIYIHLKVCNLLIKEAFILYKNIFDIIFLINACNSVVNMNHTDQTLYIKISDQNSPYNYMCLIIIHCSVLGILSI